ncbi:MAG: hypothetical protein K6A44_08070 [bacterium]|nr:hypothetical protein [bacterium]
MSGVVPVSHSPLTPSDITRLPQGAVSPQGHGAIPAMGHDEFESSQKSSALKKTIFGLVVAAAVIVGLKRWGAESFMKVKDPANLKWYDHIRNGVNKLGEWIEKPFIWAYNKCTGKAAAETPAPAPTPAA